MKILVVTDVYPPHHIGGYELGCRDVADKLRARGHDVHILTSTYRTHPGNEAEKYVERTLQFNLNSSDPAHDKRAEIQIFRQTLRRVKPDVVYFWNQRGLTFWLPLAAHWEGFKMAFFLSDSDFTAWCVSAWLLAVSRKNSIVRALFGKSFLVRGWPIIENRTCHFCSEFLRSVAVKNGIAFAPRNSVVAHWGIEQAQFAATPRERWPVKKLLYVGQMIPQKGIHTAIAALGLLAKEKNFSEVTLSLAGGGLHPDYEKKLRELPAQLGLAGRVNFLGKIPRPDLTRVYAEHDALLFPSEWDEPFAITPLEAIASGLAVIGTTTGGSGELFRNRETAMTFAAGDAADCARAVRELCADRELFEKISFNARLEVRSKHTLDAMVDKIERSLKAET